MTTELRVLHPSEWDDWYTNFELAFGGIPTAPEERDLVESLTEHRRSIGVWDGPDVVATAGAYSFRVAVPGGALVPAAGVTMVSVAATHRRRGLLTSMMRRQLDDVRSWGEPIAVLTASEPAIYGRFGYGAATQRMFLEIDSDRVRLELPEGVDGIRLRSVDPVSAIPAMEAVYAELAPGRPGTPARAPGWERAPVVDPESDRKSSSRLQCVLAERVGQAVGYVTFRNKPDWDMAGPSGTLLVRGIAGLDPAAYAALWRHLMEFDLTARVTCDNRPVDDAVLHLVSDVRRCNVRLHDGLHVRLVELGAALEARAYRAPLDVVFEVADDFCPWNAGRWRLITDTKGGASCERTEEPVELALSVRELGAAYLGGVSFTSLAAAGRVRELRPGALAETTAAFASDVAPWLPHGF
ncbi:GNAT family N-acetyltransferase [Streptomyces sp. DT24]|uniref:GNAT family N-acetyltransferase n=1 Tax=Streptomyces sp. DT24 TaxID=3416520 RepID=UPI003CFB7B05